MNQAPRRIVLLAFPHVEMLDVAGAFEAAIQSMKTGAPVQVTKD